MNFKVKSKKVDKRRNQVVETLDSKHFDMIRQIECLKDTLPALRHLLAHHEKKLQEYHLQKQHLNNKLATSTGEEEQDAVAARGVLDDKIYVSIYHEEEMIQKLKLDIAKIQNNEYMNEYFLKTGHLLYEYYDGQKAEEPEQEEEGEDEGEEEGEDEGEGGRGGGGGGGSEEEEEEGGGGDETKRRGLPPPLPPSLSSVVKKTKITDYIEKDQGFDKANI